MGIVNTIARNTTFGFIASVSEIGIAFVMGIVLTRSLGTEQYGLYAYLMWFVVLVSIITNLGLGEMSRRFIPEAIGRQSAHEPTGFVQLTLILRTAVALVISFAIMVTAGFWAQLAGEPANQLLFIIVAVAVLAHGLQLALVAIFKGFQKFQYAFYLTLVIFPLRLILVIVIMALGFGVLEVLFVNIATLILGVLFGFALLHRLVPLKNLLSTSLLSSDTKKRALRYSLTIAGVLAIGYLVNQQAEIFFIGLFWSVKEVGFYNLAFKVSSLVRLLPTAFAFALLPAIAERFGSGELEKIKRIYHTSARYLMVVALPLAAGGITLADSLIILLYGVDYAPAVILLQVLIVPLAIGGIAGAGGSVIRGINRPGFILKTTALLAILKIGLLLWLVPGYGVIGAAVASSVPLVLGLPAFIIFISKRVGVDWPVQDTIKIAIASLIMGLIVYALQSQLGVVLSLAVCIPLGIIVYTIAIFALGVIREQDLAYLKRIQGSLPLVLRKYYSGLIGLMERIIIGKN